MGFWAFLFGKTVKTGDDFFGEMTFRNVPNDPAQSYFECRRYFAPSEELIELSVTGSLNGLTQSQKDFFTQVECDYPLLISKLIPIIEAEFSAWMTGPVIQDFAAEFKPVYMSIPACDQRPIAWEIAFDTVHDVNHTVTVGMLGDEPQHVHIDG